MYNMYKYESKIESNVFMITAKIFCVNCDVCTDFSLNNILR